jgi:hypothetical protein
MGSFSAGDFGQENAERRGLADIAAISTASGDSDFTFE